MPLSRPSIITGRDLAMLHRWASDLSTASCCALAILRASDQEWSAIATADETHTGRDIEALTNTVARCAQSDTFDSLPTEMGLAIRLYRRIGSNG
jgi:hypothetical protein